MPTYATQVVTEKVAEGSAAALPEVFPRDLSLGEPSAPSQGNLVTLVCGMRRCGKTFRLYQQMRELIDAGVPRERLLYFNFDDERLKPYRAELLDDVVETYYRMVPDAFEGGAYLFLDEVQEVPEWGTFLRRMVDSRKLTIYVTGSSSRMLSSEMPSEFRGRAITRELFPMSFSEFCRFRGLDAARVDAFNPSIGVKLRGLLDDYLVSGGFIAVQGLARQDAFQVLQGYVSQTVAQDVIDRYGLGNARAALAFATRCLAGSGREISLNKTRNEMKSLGVAVARETLSQLLGYYEESYVVYRVSELSRSLADNPRAVFKIYAADPGLAAAYSPATALDAGQRLETAVFNALRRRADLVRQGAVSRLLFDDGGKRREVDFASGDMLAGDAMALVQVTEGLSDPKTRKREVDGLVAGMRRLGVEEGAIVTLDEREEIVTPAGTVHVVPAWEWLLD